MVVAPLLALGAVAARPLGAVVPLPAEGAVENRVFQGVIQEPFGTILNQIDLVTARLPGGEVRRGLPPQKTPRFLPLFCLQ